MTSATEIRTAWPQLNDKRKQALVMSLYPTTQTKPALAQNVVKLLDTAIGTEVNESYTYPASAKSVAKQKKAMARPVSTSNLDVKSFVSQGYTIKYYPDRVEIYYGDQLVYKKPGDYSNPTRAQHGLLKSRVTNFVSKKQKEMDENQGWAATLEAKNKPGVVAQKFDKDPALRQIMLFAKQHYPQYANDPEQAMLKWLQRSLLHSKQEDTVHNQELTRLASKVQDLERKIDQIRPNPNYMDEAGRKY
jgi:hypothetical protein